MAGSSSKLNDSDRSNRRYISEEQLQKIKEAHETNKYFMARDIWPKRETMCPVPMQVGKYKQTVTWGRWFEVKYGESLFDYAERIKRDGKPKGVMEMADRNKGSR